MRLGSGGGRMSGVVDASGGPSTVGAGRCGIKKFTAVGIVGDRGGAGMICASCIVPRVQYANAARIETGGTVIPGELSGVVIMACRTMARRPSIGEQGIRLKLTLNCTAGAALRQEP